MKYKADIIVKLKAGVHDPQGSAIETILKRIEINKDPHVGVGKFFTLELECKDKQEAKKKFEQIGQEILSNPVLEKYEIINFEEI